MRNWLLILLIIIVACIAVWYANKDLQAAVRKYVFTSRVREQDGLDAQFRASKTQLGNIYRYVLQEFQHSTGGSNEVDSASTALRNLEALFGYQDFRLLYKTNGPIVAVNPEARLWKSQKPDTNQVAVYWPVILTEPGTSRSGLLAIYFGGRVDVIRGRPNWEPSLSP